MANPEPQLVVELVSYPCTNGQWNLRKEMTYGALRGLVECWWREEDWIFTDGDLY